MFLYLRFIFVYIHIIAFHMYYKKDKQKKHLQIASAFLFDGGATQI